MLIVTRKFCVSSIHPAETFPLVQAIAIIVQGVIFAVVQGAGLSSLFVQQDTCGSVARFMWAGMLIRVLIRGFKADGCSPIHSTIHPAGIWSRMCITIFPKHGIPGEREVGRYDMPRNCTGNAHRGLGTIVQHTKA